MKKLLSILLLCSCFSANTYSQNYGQRYVDEIFSDVSVEQNVVYGNNIGIMTQTPFIEELKMDVYTPEGDNNTNRPVIILIHGGEFLPALLNNKATGDKSDNHLVELCKRYAKKGYVTVSINYRLGWNPFGLDFSDNEFFPGEISILSFYQAFYRAQQDARAAVRYLRRTVAEMGNPYGISDKFIVGGEGVGGAIAVALASLDKQSEFTYPSGIDYSSINLSFENTMVVSTPNSVDPQILGNFQGTSSGIIMIDNDGDGTLESEVQLCIPNHYAYSDAIDMAFNFGGTVLDTNWIEPGEAPIAAFHNINDDFYPFIDGYVNFLNYDYNYGDDGVHSFPNNIYLHGSYAAVNKSTSIGNNDCFQNLSNNLFDATYQNGDGVLNATLNGGMTHFPGVFQMVTPEPSLTPCGIGRAERAPWQWWDNEIYGEFMGMLWANSNQSNLDWECYGLLSNPNMSEEKALTFIDMLDDFFTPRILSAILDYEYFNEFLDIYSSTISENTLLNEENISLQADFDSLSNQILDLQQEILVPNIDVDLAIGWNMVGFSCPQQKNAEDALINIVDEVIIFKDNSGNVYMPEFSFNGIGDLTPGHGYQLKVTDYILDFNICE